MKKFLVLLPTILPLLTIVVNLVTPAVAAFWASHASASAIIAPLAMIAAHLLPSPLGNK